MKGMKGPDQPTLHCGSIKPEMKCRHTSPLLTCAPPLPWLTTIFLRATYDMLLRAPVPDRRAIDAAFAALDAAHARLKAAHLQQAFGLLN